MAWMKPKHWWAAGAAAMALVPFLPLLRAGLLFDDKMMAERSLPLYRTMGDAFSIPQGAGTVQPAFFRPLLWLTFMLDRALSSAGTYLVTAHAATLLYQLAAVLLLFALARELFSDEPLRDLGAGFAALVFAALPSHLESAATATSRTDVLAALFTFASLAAAARWLRKAKVGEGAGVTLLHAAAAAALFLLGALSKEVAVAALALLPLVFLYLRHAGVKTPPPARLALFAAPFALAAGSYFAMRAGFGTKGAGLAALSLAESLERLVAALGFYLQRLALPLRPIVFEREMPPFGPGALALAASLLPTAWALVRGGRPRRLALFAWGWFLAALAPSLLALFFPMITQPVADRFLYLPSAAYALTLGALAARVPAKGVLRAVSIAALAALVAVYGATTFSRAKIWQSERTYWEAAVADPIGAKSSNLWLNVGNAQKSEGDSEDAAFSYRRALILATERFDRYPALFALSTTLLDLADDSPPARVRDLASEAAEHLEELAGFGDRYAGAVGPGVVERELAFACVRAASAEYTLSGQARRDLLEKGSASAAKALRANPDDPSAAASLQKARQMLNLAGGVAK